MPKLLLHACCAPCSAAVYQELQRDFDITIFYFNDNIWPAAEYEKRLAEVKKYYQKLGANLIIEDYDHDYWLKQVEGLEHEPERGERCRVCYHYRLAKTAAKAKELAFDFFGTVMSISPFKDAVMLNEVGQQLAAAKEISFYPADFKQAGGYQKSLAISRQENFYRQKYCGCEFSWQDYQNRLHHPEK